MYYSNLDEIISRLSFEAVGAATALIIILIVVSLLIKKPSANTKLILFTLISTIAIVTTLFLAGSTIYLNTVSSSNGPVHWHADLEIWNCGTQLDIVNPTGLSNKVGTATLHEHNDKRIHLEGVVITPIDASLGKFFHVLGGEIRQDMLQIPTTQGMMTLNSSQGCPGIEDAQLQVFVYKTTGKQYHQEKLTEHSSYIISPYSSIPAGDCIIIELDRPKEQTEKICLSYQVAEQLGKIHK